jgi:predicted O-methyltransferase YrrM
VLEIGTSNGVSAIWMALGLKETGGKLTTLEIDPERAKLARENFRQAEVADRITLIEGDALQTLGTLAGTYDLVFIDAAKPQYKKYLEIIFPRIQKGGIIVAHNAVRQAASMQDYLEHVRDHPELDTVILTTGDDGVALSYKK